MKIHIRTFALSILASMSLAAQGPFGAQQGMSFTIQAQRQRRWDLRRQSMFLAALRRKELGGVSSENNLNAGRDQANALTWLSQPPSKVMWRVQGVGGVPGPDFDGERLIFTTKYRQIQSVDPGSGVVRWSIAGESWYEIPPLLLSNRLVYCSPDYVLTMVDADSGRQVRKLDLNEWKKFFISGKAGHPRVLTPTLGGGCILVATFGRDPEGTSNGRIHSYDPGTGQPVWESQIPGGPDTDPLVFGGRVILGGELGIWALDLKDGKPAWSLSRKAGDPLLDAAIIDGKLVLSSEKSLMALDPDTGKQVWSVPTDMSLTCLMGEGGYLVARESRENGFTHGVTVRTAGFDLANGKRLWETNLFSGSFPWVQSGHVYGCSGREVFGLDLTSGKQIWTCKLAPGFQPGILPISDMVLVHCEFEGKTSIRALGGADGKARWVYELEGGRGLWPILPTRQGFLLPFADEQLLSIR